MIPSRRLRDAAGRGGGARRTHHARADPAPRRSARDAGWAARCIIGRAEHGDVLRLEGLPRAQRPPAPAARPRHRRRAKTPARALPRRRRASCRSCSARTAACCAIRASPSSPAASAWSRRSIRQGLRRRDRRRGTGRARRGRLRGVRGLSVLVLDCRSFGGQAGASARIENYLGFPTGISGMALMARAYNQAQKFGAEMVIPDEVVTLQCHASARDRASSSVSANGEARQRARRRDRQRRPLPAPRRREPRGVRGLVASTTGPRRSRAGCAPGRRSRSSAPATPRDRRPCIWRARPRRCGCSCAGPSLDADDVALSGRPHRGPAERRGADADGDHRARRQAPAPWTRSAGDSAPRRGDRAGRSATSSCSSAPSPNTDWLSQSRRRARRQGLRARPARTSAATAGRSRRAVPACSRSATSARAR